MRKLTKKNQESQINDASEYLTTCSGACRYECLYGGPGPQSVAYAYLTY